MFLNIDETTYTNVDIKSGFFFMELDFFHKAREQIWLETLQAHV